MASILFKTAGDGSCCECEHQAYACECGSVFWYLEARKYTEGSGWSEWTATPIAIDTVELYHSEFRFVYTFTPPYDTITFHWVISSYNAVTEVYTETPGQATNPGLTAFPVGSSDPDISYNLEASWYAVTTYVYP